MTGVTGDPLAPAWYMLVAALLGLVAMILMRETAPIHVGDDRGEPKPGFAATSRA